MQYNIENLFVGKVEFASYVSGKECFTNNRYIFRKLDIHPGHGSYCELISNKSYYPVIGIQDECVFVGAIKLNDFSAEFPEIDKVSYEDIIFLESVMNSKDNDFIQTKKLVVNG